MNLAKTSWCLCKLIYFEGENAVNNIITCKWIRLDDLALENKGRVPKLVQWCWIGMNQPSFL
jgi:hypothetical protein